MSEDGNLTVVGLQWGDEGKGKIVDYLSEAFGAVARFNGGSNAGHTVVVSGKKYTFHLAPSGAVRRKKLFIGPGVAVDTSILADELALLRRGGFSPNVAVDGRCTLVSPLEKRLDSLLESMRGSGALGTTLRGVGPSYAMRALRLAPRAFDIFGKFDLAAAKRFYSALGLRADELSQWVADSRTTLRGLLGDVSTRIEELNERGENVLFEGSQGTLLDILHGTYPFVTASHTVASYAPVGSGLPPGRTGSVLGVAKCYTTRVGAGPFPTEMSSREADQVRERGTEYGATTGRPRRIGWLDLVALKYAVEINGVKELALSKLDVLSSFRGFRVCVAYRLDGSEVTSFKRALPRLGSVEPVYERPAELSGSRFDGGLPAGVRSLVDYLEDELDVRVTLVSYGQERSRTFEL